MTQLVLGLSAYYHDSAAALVQDGVVVAAAQEERFSRTRHDRSFPRHAVEYCLDHAGIELSDLMAVAYHEDPALKFRRVRSSFRSAGLRGLGAFAEIHPQWRQWKRDVLSQVARELRSLDRGTAPAPVHSRHHRSHAASAFFPSPFESAAVLAVDGVGEWQTTSVWHGSGRQLSLVNSISYPHSLGLLYSAFTAYCGFKVDSGEYKLMGLAPYGRPVYADLIRRELINLREDGSFTLDMRYFEFLRGRRMVGRRFEDLLGGPVRRPESDLTQRECDLAASVQEVTEQAVLGLARFAARATGERFLTLAGGVALNCVANGVLSRSGLFEDIWVQPAAGDAGCALGAALDVAVPACGRPHLVAGPVPDAPADRAPDGMSGSLLGPAYDDDQIRAFLTAQGYPFTEHRDGAVNDATAELLGDGAVVGWFQGRMEFGPRALGSRSILGDPRDRDMQRTMNLKIKFRESFRPFAPAVLREDAHRYFELTMDSPYMLLVSQVTEEVSVSSADTAGRGLGSLGAVRSTIPAVTHVDRSARVQTVDDESAPAFAALLRSFKKRTGCPVLVNTSFNVRGEPIVRTPQEAYRCFMRTGMDALVMGSFLLLKDQQPTFAEAVDWRSEIPLD